MGIAEGKLDSVPETDYVLLRKTHPKIFLSPKIKKVIADGSNYPNVIEKIISDSVEIYYTAKEGAFLKSVE